LALELARSARRAEREREGPASDPGCFTVHDRIVARAA
jgi:hypothetical protein